MRMTMKKFPVLPACAFALCALTACGDDVVTQNVYQVDASGTAWVKDASELPECSAENEGQLFWVRSDYTMRVCVDGAWQLAIDEFDEKPDIEIPVDTSKDSGDVSGEVSDIDTIPEDPIDDDSFPVSLDSLSGFSQKGPFVKGSVVSLYELQDGRTLKQTNGNFVGTIDSDDGFFKFKARDLISQYALLEASGYYRNEVTGKNTTSKLSLLALTDVSARSRANVNLLTHLEYSRVHYLVTHDKMRLKEAKRKAKNEILNIFHFDTTGIGSAEDLNIVGTEKGSAELLAISIILQGDRSVADLTELLTQISNDIEDDGALNDGTLKYRLAGWVATADTAIGRFAGITNNVKNWKLGEVPDFIPLLRKFWHEQLFGGCAKKQNGKPFTSRGWTEKNGGVTRSFRNAVCDADTVRFLKRGVETDLQRACVSYLEGTLDTLKGQAYSVEYLCQDGEWVYQKSLASDKIGTMTDERDGHVYKTVQIGQNNWMAENLAYVYLEPTTRLDSSSFCTADWWCLSYAADCEYEKQHAIENEEEDPDLYYCDELASRCPNYGAEFCEKYGRTYTWSAAIDSTALANDAVNPMTCGGGAPDCDFTGVTLRGICPEGWHLPDGDEWLDLFKASNAYSDVSVCDYGHCYNIVGNEYMAIGQPEFSGATNALGFSVLSASQDGGACYWSSIVTEDEIVAYVCIGPSQVNFSGRWTKNMILNFDAGKDIYTIDDTPMFIRCVEDK